MCALITLLLNLPIYDVHISLTLGGGYGFLTGEHGLALDNLVQVSCNTYSLY